MTRRASTRVAVEEQVRRCGRRAVLRAAAACDGHTILDPRVLVDAGVPAEVVAHLTRTHRSDGTFKGTILSGGGPVAQVRGVAGLDALRLFADALGVRYRRAYGRGSEAHNIRTALARHFAGPPPASSADVPPEARTPR